MKRCQTRRLLLLSLLLCCLASSGCASRRRVGFRFMDFYYRYDAYGQGETGSATTIDPHGIERYEILSTPFDANGSNPANRPGCGRR